MKKVLSSLFGIFLGIFFLALTGAGWWTYQNWSALNTPLQPTVRTFEVPRGATYNRTIDALEQAGLARNSYFLKIYGRLFPAVTDIKAGEYFVEPGDTTWSILARIRRGQVAQHPVTIPEGYNIWQVATAMAAAGLVDEAEFLRLTSDETFLAELGVAFHTVEGYLFPDTYFFARRVGARNVIRTMVNRFHQSLPPNYEKRAEAVGLTVPEAIILASIIEKETGTPEERRLVSAVFHNRLKRNMRLQTDPTVVYGRTDVTDRIRRRHLDDRDHPYNTYQIHGLPPGPIANPGRASLEAAVDPAPVSYLFFVSKNDGTHYFSNTYAEHNRAVDLYQRRR
jgi:UPF0755 protein